MILEHQTRMANLNTRVGYETAVALDGHEKFNKAYHQPLDQIDESTKHRINSAVNEIVRCMLFLDEGKLGAPVKGFSGFAAAFQKVGVRDWKGVRRRSPGRSGDRRRDQAQPAGLLERFPAGSGRNKMIERATFCRTSSKRGRLTNS